MTEYSVQPNHWRGPLSPERLSTKISGMPKIKGRPHSKKTGPKKPLHPPHFIKEWRIYREMTVAALAEAADMSTGNLSALENRQQGPSDKGLAKLANALKTTPGALLNVDPTEEGTGDFWRMWERASEPQREKIADAAKIILRPDKSR